MNLDNIIQVLAEIGDEGRSGAEELKEAVLNLDDDDLDTRVREGMDWVQTIFYEIGEIEAFDDADAADEIGEENDEE